MKVADEGTLFGEPQAKGAFGNTTFIVAAVERQIFIRVTRSPSRTRLPG